MRLLQRTALCVIILWFTLGGVAHFLWPQSFLKIMPPVFPYPLEIVYISGFFELLGAAGVLLARTRRAAGLGLALLTICVTPANVYMWQHAEQFPDVPPSLLLLRLPLQVLLVVAIVWSTRRRVPRC